jgi:hypothetical protein
MKTRYDLFLEEQNETIYIPIAACKEYFIKETVKSAIANARNPKRVYYGIYNNITSKDKSLIEDEFFTNNDNIFYTEVFSKYPLGIGYGRMNASLLTTAKHDYVFQIDSHTIFTKNWDTILIKTFKKIAEKEKTEKIVLTAMAGADWSYNPENRKELKYLNLEINDLSYDSFEKNSFSTYINNSRPGIVFENVETAEGEIIKRPLTSSIKDWNNNEYEESDCVYGAFMFSKYSLVREVMHDPRDPIHGDQINYAIRLFSRDYKIFAVKQPLILLLGKRDKNGKIVDPEYDWTNEINSYGNSYGSNINNESFNNYKNIINGSYLGYWGAPDKDSLEKAKKKMGYK